jgi:hypothetical protein
VESKVSKLFSAFKKPWGGGGVEGEGNGMKCWGLVAIIEETLSTTSVRFFETFDDVEQKESHVAFITLTNL